MRERFPDLDAPKGYHDVPDDELIAPDWDVRTVVNEIGVVSTETHGIRVVLGVILPDGRTVGILIDDDDLAALNECDRAIRTRAYHDA